MKYSKKRLINLFSLVYFVSYITRINFGAIISEMVIDIGISKGLLSMSLTGGFITYGLGQIISGVGGEKYSPYKLISIGLGVTSLMNILITLTESPYQMCIIWCVNGFAQAFMWPPLVKITTSKFTEEEYKNAVVQISWGSSFGVIAIYLLAPLLISIFGWRSVFIFSAMCGIYMLARWTKYFCNVNNDIHTNKTNTMEKEKLRLFSPVILAIMLAIIIQGMLRDGVTTWMPSFISETFKIDNKISILTGVLLPIFSIFSLKVTAKLYQLKCKNPITCAGMVFGGGTFVALLLFLLANNNIVLSVVLTALLTGCMHGVNLLLICMIPPFFERVGKVSTVSGILNSCTYLGSAISTYGIAILSENFGWNVTLEIWFILAAIGTVLCFVTGHRWKMEQTMQ